MTPEDTGTICESKILCIVKKTIAVAITYSLNKTQSERTILIYEFSGEISGMSS